MGLPAALRSARRFGPLLLAVSLMAAGVALLLEQAQVRVAEASFSAGLLRFLHLDHARTVGFTVVFPHGARWIGYSVTASCTAALLIAPFCAIGAVLLASGRVRARTGLLAVAAAAVIVWFANQLRLLVIGASMRLWGFSSGYSRSHVLAGGVISTLGVAVGIAVFVIVVLSRPHPTHPPTV